MQLVCPRNSCCLCIRKQLTGSLGTPCLQVEVISSLEAQHAELLKQLTPAQQAHHATRHRQAAAVPGVRAAVQAVCHSCEVPMAEPRLAAGSGQWIFPALITDELAFAASVRGAEPAGNTGAVNSQ